ncbi:hypothetical protein ACPXCG_14545 [Gordonia sp. DT218]|uniref:hypothetical protein n=1 Tax=Gordonia sp. DT218 TaxID=3416659 RepID=UPI003CF551FA
MSNALLLVPALGLLVLAFWRVRGRATAGWPALWMSLIFVALSVFGYPAWSWSKSSLGAGLPSDALVVSFADSVGVRALLVASMAASAIACLMPRGFRVDGAGGQHRSSDQPARSVSSEMAWWVAGLSALVFVCWCLGQGPSLLIREVYLDTDGIQILLRATTPGGTLAAMATTATLFLCHDRRPRNVLFVLTVVWFMSLLAIGTRGAVTIPVMAGLMIIARGRHDPMYRRPMFLAGGVLIGVAILTFGWVIEARYGTHGLLFLPRVIFGGKVTAMTDDPSAIARSVRQVVASVAASYPIVDHSVIAGVPMNIQIQNANPLLGSGNSAELERYFPWDWVPLSFAGTWYGATGILGQLGVFGVFAAVPCMLYRLLDAGPFAPYRHAGTVAALMLAFLSVQYSSRLCWRFFWVLLVACALVSVFNWLVARSSTGAMAEGWTRTMRLFRMHLYRRTWY